MITIFFIVIKGTFMCNDFAYKGVKGANRGKHYESANTLKSSKSKKNAKK